MKLSPEGGGGGGGKKNLKKKGAWNRRKRQVDGIGKGQEKTR